MVRYVASPLLTNHGSIRGFAPTHQPWFDMWLRPYASTAHSPLTTPLAFGHPPLYDHTEESFFKSGKEHVQSSVVKAAVWSVKGDLGGWCLFIALSPVP